MNKKASVQDVGIAMIYFFGAVILFLVVAYSFDVMVDKIKLTPAINSSSVSISSFESANELTKRYDYVSLAILLGFTLAIIITGWLVPVNSIFMWLYLLFLSVIVMVSGILSYVWGQIYQSSNGRFVDIIGTHFPIANHILNFFPIYITIIGFLGMLVMFAKPNNGGLE